MNSPIRHIQGPRTFIVTHLRKWDQETAKCENFWLKTRSLVSNRIYQTSCAYGMHFTGQTLKDAPGLITYSLDGKICHTHPSIDEMRGTLPDSFYKNIRYSKCDTARVPNASDLGFPSSDDNVMIIGGGMLKYCVRNKIESIVEKKRGQRSPLQIIMPLPLMWGNNHDARDYMLGIGIYSASPMPHPGLITWDGEDITDKMRFPLYLRKKYLEIHCFTTLKNLFTSGLFPEIKTGEELGNYLD